MDDQDFQAHLDYQADKDHRENPARMQQLTKTYSSIWLDLDRKDLLDHKDHLVSLVILDYQD